MGFTKKQQVLDRVFFILQRGLPDIVVLQEEIRPVEIPLGGLLILRDGIQGNAEELLGNPPINLYRHRIELEVFIQETYSRPLIGIFDKLVGRVRAVLTNTDKLAGIADRVSVEGFDADNVREEGTKVIRQGVIPIIVEYADTLEDIEDAKSLVGPKGIGGLGQYRLYANIDNGTTPDASLLETPTIGFDGVLPTIAGWSEAVLASEPNKVLWTLIGYGGAKEVIKWAGVYQIAIKGEKGNTGDTGQGGLGQYRFYGLYDDGSTPTIPTVRNQIGANGVLLALAGWNSNVPNPAANKSLWILEGRGKASAAVRWSGVYKTG